MANYNQVSYGSGDKNTVTELQKLLNQNGANLTVDGVFGNKTQQAVIDYQKANNLIADGVVGNQTWGALTNAQSAATAITPATQAMEPVAQQAFKVSDSTAAADKKRQEVAAQKPGDFTYGAYEKSDAVKQAEELLKQQLANKPGEYQSAWQTQLDEMLQKILNREKFSYDMNGDALYQQYKDQYSTQGKMAMMDTMGQAQAMTGGYGNSYAQGVGQQAYQGYLQQLNDRIPELYQLALSQYNQEGQDLYSQYGMYADREAQDYGRYRDTVSDYYNDLDYYTNDARYKSEQDYGRWSDDRNFAYGQHRDDVADWQYDQNRADDNYWNQFNRDYAQERDKVADQQWQAQFDEDKRRYDEQMALSQSKSSGSSSSSRGVSGGDEDNVSDQETVLPDYDEDSDWEYEGVVEKDFAWVGSQINRYMANGADKSDINNFLTDAYHAGYITTSQYKDLKNNLVSRGYAI